MGSRDAAEFLLNFTAVFSVVTGWQGARSASPRDRIDTLMNEKDLRSCIDCRESESNEERRVASAMGETVAKGKVRGKSGDPEEAIMSSAVPRNCLRFVSTSAAESGTEEQRPVPGPNGSRDNLGETNLLRSERNESVGLQRFSPLEPYGACGIERNLSVRDNEPWNRSRSLVYRLPLID